MVNKSLTLYTKSFFGSFLTSPTQMGSLSINNSVTNISRLGTFKNSQPPSGTVQSVTSHCISKVCVLLNPLKISPCNMGSYVAVLNGIEQLQDMANKPELGRQTFFKVHKAQIRKFWGIFRYRTSVFSQVCHSANHKSANFYD
jgi:hypothetical protein